MSALVELNPEGIATRSPVVVSKPEKLLEPYQIAWAMDRSRIKVMEASRRVGKTFGEAFVVVRDRLNDVRQCDSWFSSSDESAAREFIEACAWWCRVFGDVVEVVEQRQLFERDDIKVFTINFPGGSKVTAMASSPKSMRSKGGGVILDEFAHHEKPAEMWRASYPVISRGGRLSVLSSHNGEQSEFEKLCAMGRRRLNPAEHGDPKSGDYPVSLHTVTIYDAVDQGLVNRINSMEGTAYTCDEYLAELRAGCDAETWSQEYECRPSSQASSYFPFDLIRPLVRDGGPLVTDNVLSLIHSIINYDFLVSQDVYTLYAGVDIGRTQDEFAVWVNAKIGAMHRCVGVLAMRGQTFTVMEGVCKAVLGMNVSGTRCQRMCIDKTGIGMQLAERMCEHAPGRVEGVTFTNPSKKEMATTARRVVEERCCTLPDDTETLAQLTSIRKTVTAAGNERFDAERTATAHADRAWAWMLALHAGEAPDNATRTVPIPAGVF